MNSTSQHKRHTRIISEDNRIPNYKFVKNADPSLRPNIASERASQNERHVTGVVTHTFYILWRGPAGVTDTIPDNVITFKYYSLITSHNT